MTPIRVTAPAAPVVSLPDLKAHLRVDHSDEDGLIGAYQDGAVAMLDGYGGVLGRCIMPQRWSLDVVGPGPHDLPFPDARDIEATSSGAELDVIDLQELQAAVPRIMLPELVPGWYATITAEYGLPVERLPAAQALVKLIVGNWYHNREAVVVGAGASDLPMAANALISALRWFRI